jgi:hypothetical protein
MSLTKLMSGDSTQTSTSSTQLSTQKISIPSIEEQLRLNRPKTSTADEYQSNFATISRSCQELCQSLVSYKSDKYIEKLNLFLLVKQLFEKDIDFVPKITNTINDDSPTNLHISNYYPTDDELPPPKRHKSNTPDLTSSKPSSPFQSDTITFQVSQPTPVIQFSAEKSILVRKAPKCGAPRKLKQKTRFENLKHYKTSDFIRKNNRGNNFSN